MLGINARLGRIFLPEDDAPTAAPVAVISERYWRSRFGSAPDVVGKVVTANTVQVTIVGVLPRRFTGIQEPVDEPPDMTFPVNLDPQINAAPPINGVVLARLSQPTYWWLQVMGRLRPGATAAQVQGHLGGVFQATAKAGLDSYLAGLDDKTRGNSNNRNRTAVPELRVEPGAQRGGSSLIRGQQQEAASFGNDDFWYNTSYYLRLNPVTRQTQASKRLYESAQGQGGFFTTRQALEAGYEDNVHPYHVRSGNWVREVRGVYRLAQFPTPTRPDLMLWQLWSHNRRGEAQGTFSHTTALTLHDLSDAMPSKLDMTVPSGFQRMATIPEVLHLHRARLPDRDVETMDGVRVTTPLRTLIDVIVEGAIAPELQVQAVDQAIRRGLVMRRQLEAAKTSTRARQRIDRVLKKVPDDRSTPIRNSRRAPDRTRSATKRTVAS